MRMGWIAGVLGVVTWLGIAADARACSCIGEWSLFAPSDDEHPSGASILFSSSCGGSFEPWSVTVDGAPATFGEPAIDGEIASAQIVPTPAEGAEVVVMLDSIERARFTIVPPDTSPPPPADAVTLELLEDSECFSIDGFQAIDVGVQFVAREHGTRVAIEMQRSDGLLVTHTSIAVPQDSSVHAIIQADAGLLEFPETCVHATVYDASGNVTLNTENPSDIFPQSAENCLFAEADGSQRHGPLRRCSVAPEQPWQSLLLGLLLLLRRRRVPRCATT